MSCSISLPKRAYVPGETLRAEILVHNLSIRKSGAVSLQLKQVRHQFGGIWVLNQQTFSYKNDIYDMKYSGKTTMFASSFMAIIRY